MKLTLVLLPLGLVIYGAIIYLFVLLVKALRKYIKSKDVRNEKRPSAARSARRSSHTGWSAG